LRRDAEPREARPARQPLVLRGLPRRLPGDPGLAPRRRREGNPRAELRSRPVREGPGLMSELALKIGSIVTTLLVMVGGYGYAATHLKNPNAPLQPAVEKSLAEKPALATPVPPTSTPIP